MLIWTFILLTYCVVEFTESKIFNAISMDCTKESNSYVAVDQCQLTPKTKGVVVANFRARVKSRISPDLFQIFNAMEVDRVYKPVHNLSFDFCRAIQGNLPGVDIPVIFVIKALQVIYFFH